MKIAPGNKSLFRRGRHKRYSISADRRLMLQHHIKKHRPWLKSTGPKSVVGKKRSSQNALKHGMFTPDFAPMLKGFLAVQKWVTRQGKG